MACVLFKLRTRDDMGKSGPAARESASTDRRSAHVFGLHVGVFESTQGCGSLPPFGSSMNHSLRQRRFFCFAEMRSPLRAQTHLAEQGVSLGDTTFPDAIGAQRQAGRGSTEQVTNKQWSDNDGIPFSGNKQHHQGCDPGDRTRAHQSIRRSHALYSRVLPTCLGVSQYG